VNCSLCQKPIANEKGAPTCHVIVDSHRASIGRFCSTRCRDAVASTIAIRTTALFPRAIEARRSRRSPTRSSTPGGEAMGRSHRPFSPRFRGGALVVVDAALALAP
jgi:hypothetical protein